MAVLLVALLVTDERTPVPGFFDLPVTGGAVTFDMLGLRPEERGSAISLLARSMFSQGGSAAARAASVRQHVLTLSQAQRPGAGAESAPVTIAVPLTEDHWRDLLPPPQHRGDLFAGLIANRSVLLVCAGTLSTDASVRALLGRDRGLLRWITRTAPAAFWLSARSLRIDDDRVAVPGGDDAAAVWEALAGERVARPAEFLRALLTRDHGRLAWFYDAVAAMTPQRRAAVFGQGPAAAQTEQVRALYASFRHADPNWRIEDHPFLRGVTDPWIVASQVALDGDAIAPPAPQWFWEALFERSDLPRRAVAGIRRAPATPATLAWITHQVTSVAARERRDRYEMVRVAQGVFGRLAAADYEDALVALGGYRRYRALVLTLDRMDITAPRVYARAVEAARRLDDLPGRDRRHAIISMQTALVAIERARLARALDAAGAERLVLGLAGAALDGGEPAGAVTTWLLTTLLDALPPLAKPDQWSGGAAYESRLLQALAGGRPGTAGPTVEWEGLTYRVDYVGAEHARLTRIREQLASPGLDAAVAAGQSAQVAEALLVLVYTHALGDPEGAALLGGDIPLRHSFGLDGAAGLRREPMAWTLPREQVGSGTPWHIEGSLLGLDLALARLSLRRLADNEMPVAPTINLNDLLTLARTAVVMNPRDLADADRDQLVAAIARGGERVAAAGTDLAHVRALAEEAVLPAAVRQTLAWTLTRTPELGPALFGLRDLLWLGRPEVPAATLDRWGVYAEGLESRIRTRMPRPAPWEDFSGRADGGVMATQAPDLTLRLAQETARLKLPAQLVPGLLGYATQDFWHDVESRFPDDWPALARQALALSPDRVEDYVAALAGGGPLRP
jgi:hypothetical protein